MRPVFARGLGLGLGELWSWLWAGFSDSAQLINGLGLGLGSPPTRAGEG